MPISGVSTLGGIGTGDFERWRVHYSFHRSANHMKAGKLGEKMTVNHFGMFTITPH